MNDFSRELPELRSAILASVDKVLGSGHYILGKKVLEFENNWANICQIKYSIGVANGLDAIEISLRAIGIKAGDEVITSSMTAFATVIAIIKVGAVPVFADINEQTALLCVESARRCLSSKTKAIILVHLYGFVDKMDEWVSLCAQHEIKMIEDCAQSHQAQYKGKIAGTFGVCGAYSFYPTKNLGCVGDAGAIITNDEAVNIFARDYRNYGQVDRYNHALVGMNSRLDEIQAAILLEKLKYLGSCTKKRRLIAQRYINKIENLKIRLLKQPTDQEQHVYHLFVVLSEKREELAKHLTELGIQSIIHYPVPAHLQKAKFEFKKDSDGLKNTEMHASNCLSIPIHPYLNDDEVNQIIAALNSF